MIANDRKTISFLYRKYLATHWKAVVFIVLANIIGGFLLSIRPLVLAPAIDTFSAHRAEPANKFTELTLNNIGPTLIEYLGLDYSEVMYIAIMIISLFMGLTVVIAVVGLAGQYVMIRLQTAVSFALRRDLHQHVLTLPLSFFFKNKHGDLVSRLTQDVATTSNSINVIARGLLTSFGQVFVSLVILLKTEVGLTLLVLGVGSIHVFITRVLQKRMKRGSHSVMQANGDVSAGVSESILGIRIIKSFAAEQYESSKVERLLSKLREVAVRYGMLKYYETPMRILADATVVCVVLVLIFNEVQNQQLTPAGAALFLYLAQQLSAPLGQLMSTWLGMSGLLGSAARIMHVFETENDIRDGDRKVKEFEKGLTLNNISFGYEAEQPIIRNLSLEIHKGQMVALVGPSGSGKSTLTDIMLRLYDVDSGTVEYDGTDVKNFIQSEYRSRFGVVAQECLLFNDTLRNNIILNHNENEDDLDHAIWTSNLRGFIDELPEGLDTYVGDRGMMLSGGQRQRVALARAIYSRPPLLILDEATSALDSESERIVQKAIDRIAKEITLIVVAHRLSTIKHADKIVVLNHGEIEATGSHDEIIKVSKTYQKLYEIQFQGDEQTMSA